MISDEDLARQPHDAYFKGAFSDPRTAALFFQSHLPPSLSARIGWSTLQVVPGSFVRESLQQAHSDLLFTVAAEGTSLHLYLVFEHQTSVDQAMPLRLLGYILAILQRHEKEHGLPLPPVVPFVLHQGPERWTVSTEFLDLLAVPPALAATLTPFLPQFRHGLLDLSDTNPARTGQPLETTVVLQLMKMAREHRLLEFFAWLAAMQEIADLLPEWLLRMSLLYALHNDLNLDLEQIERNLTANPKLKSTAMSLAQKLIATGEARGIAIGEARGEARGVWKGKLQVLEELMGVPASPDAVLDDLDAAGFERLFRQRQAEYNARFKGVP